VNRSFNILGIAAVVIQCGCAATLDLEGALAIAPYRIEESGRIVVEAHVNGQGPYGFALDTGSSITVIFDELRSELALQPIPGIKVLIHGAVASGKFDLLEIDRLEVGREVWSNPRIVSLPGLTAAGDRVGGVLGINFLRRYAVGFSSRDRVIRLFPPDLVARRAYLGWASVPLDLEPIGESGAALYFIDVDIDGSRVRALFDLGAGLNMINRPGAQLLGIARPKLRHDELFSGALATKPIVSQLAAKEVTTAGIRWRQEVFSIADLEVFEAFRLRDSPAAILGAGMFTQRDFIIDFARSRLLVKVAMKEVNETDTAPTMR